MDAGSHVWFRRPANRPTPVRRRGSIKAGGPIGNQTHESSWREWETGKVLNVEQKSPTSTVYTVALQFEVRSTLYYHS